METIKIRREQLHMSVNHLAAMIGVSPETLSRYESKRMVEKIPLSVLEALAEALHCLPGDLMDWGELDPTTEEEYIIRSYREASTDTKAAVCAVLKVK